MYLLSSGNNINCYSTHSFILKYTHLYISQTKEDYINKNKSDCILTLTSYNIEILK